MARILIVDAEPTLLETVGLLLETEGHAVVRARDGSEALGQARTLQDFDLMIADLHVMQVDGESGFTAVQRQKPAMDVLVVTDRVDDETIGKVLGLGAAGYVEKPYSVRDVIEPVNEVLLRRTRRGLLVG